MAFPTTSGLFVPTWLDILDATGLAVSLDAEDFKVAVFTNSLTGADYTTDTAYGTGAWASNEVSSAGYTAGGNALTGTTFTHAGGGVLAFDATDSSWTGVTFTARGQLVYADALAGNNALMAITYGADFPVSAGTFTVQYHSSGLWTWDVNP